MRWVAPTEKDTANEVLEKRLWDAADQFRANSGLKAGQYSTPVLGLIFLRFAEARFAQRRTTPRLITPKASCTSLPAPAFTTLATGTVSISMRRKCINTESLDLR